MAQKVREVEEAEEERNKLKETRIIGRERVALGRWTHRVTALTRETPQG